MLLDTRGRLHDPNAMEVGYGGEAVTAGQWLAWKTRNLELLDEEIMTVDVEVLVTLQMMTAQRREKGRRGEGKGMAE